MILPFAKICHKKNIQKKTILFDPWKKVFETKKKKKSGGGGGGGGGGEEGRGGEMASRD